MKRYWLGWCILILFAFPRGASMSGPFTGNWADQYYLLSYEEKGHKIFEDDKQAQGYMRRYNEVFLEKAFLTLPERLKIIAQAKKRSIPVLPIDARLPLSAHWQNEDLKRSTSQRFPCLWSFPVDSENGVYQVAVCLQKPINEGQSRWLTHELARVLKEPLARSKTVETPLPEMHQAHGQQFGERYGIYAQLENQTQAENLPQYQAAVDQTVKALALVMDQKLKDPEFLKAIGREPDLIQPEIDQELKKGHSLERLFRSYGPSQDSTFPDLVSMREQVGMVSVVVLMYFKHFKWDQDWGKVSGTVEQAISDFIAGH